jgi:hypothetical protein
VGVLINHQLRARTDKQVRWVDVAIPDGATSKTVTRPTGETRCYRARAVLPDRSRTSWSPQRCITVRR